MIGVCRERSRPADPLGRLEAVQAVHLHVEQDHGEVVVLASAQGFCAGMGFHQVVAEVVKNRIEGKKVGRLIIDHQDIDFFVHAHSLSTARLAYSEARGAECLKLPMQPHTQCRK